MKGQATDPSVLLCLSRAFGYPETRPDVEILDKTAPLNGGVNEKTPEPGSLIALQNQYVRLFINSLPEVPCVPYGSFYLEGVIMGPSTIRLKQLYQEYGFETIELPDHIAVELEFLAFLSQLSGRTEESDEEELLRRDYEFVLGHLKAWTPEFFMRIKQYDETGFYLEISEFAAKILY